MRLSVEGQEGSPMGARMLMAGETLETMDVQSPHGRGRMVLRDLVFQSNRFVDLCCSGDSNSGLLASWSEPSNPADTCSIPKV